MARLSSPSGKTLSPDVDRLGLGVELDCGEPLLSRAVTGLAASAEWDMVIYSCGRQVDHHHPRPNVAAEVPRMLERIGDYPRREAELTAVGDLKRFLVILDLHRARDRPEDLFAIDALIGRGVGYHRRCHVIAALVDPQRSAARQDLAHSVSRRI